MEPVLLIIHLFLALAIIGLVLLQRSEGGGLGIGGGGMGGLATPEGAANLLTRATAICAALFFCTSLILGILAGRSSQPVGLMDALGDAPPPAIEMEVPVQQPETMPDESSAEPPEVPIAN